MCGGGGEGDACVRACACGRACVLVCVCVCVSMCVRIFCIVMLEPLLMSTLCLHYVYIFLLIADNIFHLDIYVMCVILCMFSALSLRVGALQLQSIIIITDEQKRRSIVKFAIL